MVNDLQGQHKYIVVIYFGLRKWLKVGVEFVKEGRYPTKMEPLGSVLVNNLWRGHHKHVEGTYFVWGKL